MARKVEIELTVKLIVNLEEDETVADVINKMKYDFKICPNNAENRVIDTKITLNDIK